MIVSAIGADAGARAVAVVVRRSGETGDPSVRMTSKQRHPEERRRRKESGRGLSGTPAVAATSLLGW